MITTLSCYYFASLLEGGGANVTGCPSSLSRTMGLCTFILVFLFVLVQQNLWNDTMLAQIVVFYLVNPQRNSRFRHIPQNFIDTATTTTTTTTTT